MPELDARRSSTFKHPCHVGGRRSSNGERTSSISIESSHALKEDLALLDALSPIQRTLEAVQAVFNPQTLGQGEAKSRRPNSSLELRIQPQPGVLDGYDSHSSSISPLTAQSHESASSMHTPASLDRWNSSAATDSPAVSSACGKWVNKTPQNFGSAYSTAYGEWVEASMQQQFIDALYLCDYDTELDPLLSYEPVQMSSSFGWTMFDDMNTQTTYHDHMCDFINSV
jgi:hypothetical protein